eukprot:14348_4
MYSSAIMHPTAQTSTGLYEVDCRRTSGARYQRVDTYSVNGGRERISRARPKSQTFAVSPVTMIFSGFMSRWKPCLCMKARPCIIWYELRTVCSGKGFGRSFMHSYKFFSMNSKMRWRSFSRITSFSLMMLGWRSLRNDL